MEKLLYEIIGFFCGCMLILLTIETSVSEIPELMMRFIVNPFLFFIIMVCYFIGFLAHSTIIKEVIEDFHKRSRRKKQSCIKFFLPIRLTAGYIILFVFGPWQTFILLAFSIFYGIISVDLKKNTLLDVDR